MTLTLERCCVTKMQLIRVCIGTRRFCFKRKKKNVLRIKSTNLVVFFVVCPRLRPFSANSPKTLQKCLRRARVTFRVRFINISYSELGLPVVSTIRTAEGPCHLGELRTHVLRSLATYLFVFVFVFLCEYNTDCRRTMSLSGT